MDRRLLALVGLNARLGKVFDLHPHDLFEGLDVIFRKVFVLSRVELRIDLADEGLEAAIAC